MRLFLAVFPPVGVRASLEARLGDLPRMGRGAKWTDPEQRHVTLFFLGETPEGRVGPLREALGKVAAATLPFDATVRELGAFPGAGVPKTLFVEVSSTTEEWARLTDALRPRLVGLGFALEGKAFHPHLTLARVKDAGKAGTWLPRLRDALEGYEVSFPVDRFDLVESHLGPTGPRYEVLATYCFGKVG